MKEAFDTLEDYYVKLYHQMQGDITEYEVRRIVRDVFETGIRLGYDAVYDSAVRSKVEEYLMEKDDV